jgi:hypothetical protein
MYEVCNHKTIATSGGIDPKVFEVIVGIKVSIIIGSVMNPIARGETMTKSSTSISLAVRYINVSSVRRSRFN